MAINKRGGHPTDTRFKMWDALTWVDPTTGEEAEWSLYYLPAPPTSAWFRYKLVAENFAERKANYVLVYNPTEERLSRGNDSNLLQLHRPGLYRLALAEIQRQGLHLLTWDELKEIF